jgi:hypothetical protein
VTQVNMSINDPRYPEALREVLDMKYLSEIKVGNTVRITYDLSHTAAASLDGAIGVVRAVRDDGYIEVQFYNWITSLCGVCKTQAITLNEFEVEVLPVPLCEVPTLPRDILYNVTISAVDGTHSLTRKGPLPRAAAIETAKDWLGDTYNEIHDLRYVSMYGEVVTIEVQERR